MLLYSRFCFNIIYWEMCFPVLSKFLRSARSTGKIEAINIVTWIPMIKLLQKPISSIVFPINGSMAAVAERSIAKPILCQSLPQ